MSLALLTASHCFQWCAYNNLRASLVLVLVVALGFSDSMAFGIYSTLIALGDLTSLAGGYYGDKVATHHLTWLFGNIILIATFLIGGFCISYAPDNGVSSILIVMSLVASSIGISRCNGTSLVYSRINSDVQPDRRNSAISLMYMMLNFASMVAYGFSGFIVGNSFTDGKFQFAINKLLISSGVIVDIALCVFVFSEYSQVVAIIQQIKQKKKLLPKMSALVIGMIALVFASFFIFMNMSHENSYLSYILWIALIAGTVWLVAHAHQKKNSYNEDEKNQVVVFVFYLFWLILYCIFERQFGMVIPLFLTRHFDNNIYGVQIPVVSIMSIFQFAIIILSVIFYKTKFHDKITNGGCLIVGFVSVLIGFAILYFSCVVADEFLINGYLIVIAIICFAMADIVFLNRIFSICRVAPKRINAITSGVMMISVACSFHGAKIMAGIVALDNKMIVDKTTSMAIYQRGFLINSAFVGLSLVIAIVMYGHKVTRTMMKRVL